MTWIAPKIRIAHLSDIHVKDVRRDEYLEVFKALYKELDLVRPEVIVVCGDIFHDKTKASAHNFSDVESFLCSLVSIAPTILIPGNHDMNVKVTGSPDLLSPIFKNHSILKEPRFIYWRNSGIHSAHGVVWIIIAPDQNKPSQEQIENFVIENQMQKAARICLLHETVNGSLLFNGNLLKSRKIRVEDLNSYDAVMAGDIHLRQNIGKSKRAMYVGSLVQQNLGEDYENHGFLLWQLELAEKHPTHRTNLPQITPFNIHNERGFLKVLISKGIDKTSLRIPSKPNYYEVVYDEETNHEQLTQHVEKYSSLYGFSPRAIRLIRSPSAQQKNTSLSIQEVYSKAQSLEVHEEMIAEILGKDNHLLEEVLNLHRYHYQQMSSQQKGHMRVRLLKLDFDNFYCYGPNNSVDFTRMENKISGIIAPNQAGKSSFLDILLFALYEVYPRADKKTSIINSKAKDYYLKLQFEIDGKIGYIEKSGKKGKQLQNSNCRLFYDGENLTKGTSTLTCKEMEKLIGTYNNAEFTSFSQQNSRTDFVYLRSSERKKILAELLSFAFFENLEKKIKESQSKLNIDLRILESSYAGVNLKQLENDHERLVTQATMKKSILDEVVSEISQKKSLLDTCLATKEKIKISSIDILQKIEILEKLEKVDYKNALEKLEKLRKLTDDEELSHDEYEEYEIRIPIDFKMNFESSKVFDKHKLNSFIIDFENKKIEKELSINSNLKYIKSLELKKERLTVSLENLIEEIRLNSKNIEFDSVNFKVEEPTTFFSKEELIPWITSKKSLPITRKEIENAKLSLSKLEIKEEDIFVKIIQEISILSSIQKPPTDEAENEYEDILKKIDYYREIIAQEGEVLASAEWLKEKHSQLSTELNLWKTIVGINVKLLPEEFSTETDLQRLKEEFNELLTSENTTIKVKDFFEQLSFEVNSCKACRENKILLTNKLDFKKSFEKEKLAKQILFLLSRDLSHEENLILKTKEKISDLKIAKERIYRFEQLVSRREAMIAYNKINEKKIYWEKKKNDVETLEKASYWWLEDRKIWNSYDLVLSKIPTLKKLKEEVDILEAKIVIASEKEWKIHREFKELSTSLEQKIMIRKYWLREIFMYEDLLKKAEIYDSSLREILNLKFELSQRENELNEKYSEISKHQNEMDLLQSKRGELIRELSVAENDILRITNEIDKERKRNKKASSKQKELDILNAYRTIIDPKTGLSDRLLKKSTSYLQNEVNSILSECGASFSIFLTEDLEIDTIVGIGKQQSTIPSKLSSGYQKFVLSLAFRSALWRLSEVILPNCQFIDEGFGNCDEENLEMIIQYINSATISPSSPSIFFIVSHIDIMKNAIQEPLTIEMRSSGSYIKA